MKKLFVLALALVLALSVFGCASQPAETPAEEPAAETPAETAEAPAQEEAQEEAPAELVTIKVGASIKDDLAAQGYNLEVVEFTDYVLPNTALEEGDLDANYFQHGPYLDDFNAQNGTHLVAVAAIHYEPFGIYAGKTTSLEELADGATIPNDGTNEARALLLLEAQGLIKLNEGVTFTATKLDIAENPKNLDIQEIEAAQLPRSLQDVDLAVINGNYALDAGLSLLTDTVGAEGSDALVYAQSVNYIVVKEGNEEAAFVEALREVLNDEATQEFITETYQGSVVLALDAEPLAEEEAAAEE